MVPKRHHYNPQVYLRQFVNPARKKELIEYDLRLGTAKVSTPKESGCEDYHHSVETVDGTRDDESIEQSFHTIENQLSKLFEAIRNRKPVSAVVFQASSTAEETSSTTEETSSTTEETSSTAEETSSTAEKTFSAAE